ncbi:MAG: AMP-binding protein [Gaiellaceae bacterium]
MVVIDTAAGSFDELVRPFEASGAGISFVDRDGTRYASYAELAAMAASASRDLRAHGIAPGDMVAMSLESTPEGVAAALAVWQAGATLMSLPPPPRRGAGGAQPLYEQAFGELLRVSNCALVLGSSRLAGALGPGHRVIDPTSLNFSSGQAALDVGIPEVALVQFTSGSTGAPRGVVLRGQTIASHVDALCEAVEFEPSRGDVAVSWLPLYHDMGLIGLLLGAMSRRGPLVLMAPSVFASDPVAWLRTCGEVGASVTCAPDFAYRLAARLARFGKPIGDLSSLRTCLCGAERVSWATLRSFAEATRESGLRWEALKPVYGMAEATLAVSFPPKGRGPRRTRGDVVGLGQPLGGVELRIGASDSDVGRIALRGPWMLDSYLTAQGTIDPFDADGWLWTNDVGFVEDGELFVLGRTDEAVIVHGRNVFAEDVEAIANWTPGIEAIGAAAFRDPDADDRFVLVVEVLNDRSDDLTSLAHDIKSGVTRGLEVSVSRVVFVEAKTIPRTTSGKPIRRACREMCMHATWRADSVLADVL